MNVRELRDHLADFPDDLPLLYFHSRGRYLKVTWIDQEDDLRLGDDPENPFDDAVVIGG